MTNTAFTARAKRQYAPSLTSFELQQERAMMHVSELEQIQKMLHLTHHRNHNQHRVAKWWKPFCVLRRQSGRIIDSSHDFATLSSGFGATKGSDRSAGGKRAARLVEAENAVVKRAAYMREHVVPKCYDAFTSLVADPQFAQLGLMLLASLARINTILADLGEAYNDPKEAASEEDKALEPAAGSSLSDNRLLDNEDLGEVVTREDTLFDSRPVEEAHTATRLESAAEAKGPESIVRPDPRSQKTQKLMGSDARLEDVRENKRKKKEKTTAEEDGSQTEATLDTFTSDLNKKKKKKRKKGDEFDDLFSGLL